jgi:site-specific recombinase XerC
MENELADFLHFCGVERRLAPLTCKAYERDIRALFAVLREGGIELLHLVTGARPAPSWPPKRSGGRRSAARRARWRLRRERAP